MDLSSLVADIQGHQRKIVSASVRPERAREGPNGVALQNSRTLSFVVDRAWNAPAGNYSERWYIVKPDTREVFFEGPERLVSIWGLLAWTELSDAVADPVPLEPGKYLLVFALGGVQGGQLDFEAFEAEAQGA